MNGLIGLAGTLAVLLFMGAVVGLAEGTVRGAECANAETAVVTIESKEGFRRFRTDR